MTSLPTVVSNTNQFIDELRRESDRGAAVIGADYLDTIFEQLIRSHMTDESKHVNKLLKYPGPLSTAAARVDLAYALGWIGKQVFDDLGIIRSIRNKFSHSHTALRFDEPEISRMCGQIAALKFGGPYRLRESRDQFLFGILMLVLQLTEIQRVVQRPPKGIDPPINRHSAPPPKSHTRPN